MTGHQFDFRDPDRFDAGAVGSPGSRAFFLHARQGAAAVTVGIEKVEVAALAQRILDLLGALADPAAELEPLDLMPTVAAAAPADKAPPSVELFKTSALAIGWDADAGRLFVEVRGDAGAEDGHEASDEVDDERQAAPVTGDTADVLRVRMTEEAARSFARSALLLVMAGRPICPYCGSPIEPSGHFCPGASGLLN